MLIQIEFVYVLGLNKLKSLYYLDKKVNENVYNPCVLLFCDLSKKFENLEIMFY